MKIRLLLCSALIVYLSIAYDLEKNYLIFHMNDISFTISFAISACIIILLTTIILIANNCINWGPKSIKNWQLKQDQKTLKNLLTCYQQAIKSSLKLEKIVTSKSADKLLITWSQKYNQELLEVANNNKPAVFLSFNSDHSIEKNELAKTLYLKNLTDDGEFYQEIVNLCSQKKLIKLYNLYPNIMLDIIEKSILLDGKGDQIWNYCNKEIQATKKITLAYLTNMQRLDKLLQINCLKILKTTSHNEVLLFLAKILPENEIEKAIKFLKSNSKDLNYQLALARLYIKNNQHNIALSIYEKNLPSIKKNSSLWLELADLYITLGQYKQAQKWLNDYQASL
jgi:tetratricopeptide (TPR) repeat protein